MRRMIQIPAGEVLLKDARRKTERLVSLESFEIGDMPVSFRQFHAGSFTAELLDTKENPVSQICWLEAVKWCNNASEKAGLVQAYSIADNGEIKWNFASNGYRLPTEAEWVYACQGDSSGARYGSLRDIAWTELDLVSEPQPMGIKLPNSYGLYDTLGNVWEWCWDYLDPARYGNYRLMKGGGWADPEWSVRVGVRRGDAPDALLEDIGFRVARGSVTMISKTDCYQGWSDRIDRERASLKHALPMGWTPLET